MLIGRIYSRVDKVFRDIDGITEVRIILLQGAPGTTTKGSYRIATWDRDVPVYDSVSITGSDLAAFIDLWRWQMPHVAMKTLCHDPPYAFKLYRGSKLVTETTVCWHCSNITVTPIPFVPMECGFDADSQAAKELLELCDRILPYYRTPKEEKKTE